MPLRPLQVHVLLLMSRAVLSAALFMFVIYVTSRQLGTHSLPTSQMAVAVIAVGACVIIVVTAATLSFIRSAELAFTRYVSQNVGYTSTMILKRVIKAKVEVGICLMLLLYMPVLNVFVQGFVVVTDWNDSLASVFRTKVNSRRLDMSYIECTCVLH